MQNFKNSFRVQHPQWLLLIVLPQYCKVTSGGCSLISRLHMFSILIKTFMKRCTNNSLLSRDKTSSSLLELIDHVLLISEYVLEKHLITFDFDEKLTQSVAHLLCNITCQKIFFLCTLRLVRCFQFQGMIWKTEHGGENPDFGFILLLFTLLTLKPFILSCLFCSCKLFLLYRPL